MFFRVWSSGPMHNFTDEVGLHESGSYGGDMSNWLSGLRRFGLLLVTGCAALIASSGLMHAQGFNITNVTTNSASKASFPTMVVDANGNLNLAWVDSTAGIKFLRSTSSASGTSFGSPAMAITVSPALPA